VSADNSNWFLLNVSADVRQQLSAFDGLWPPEDASRGTTIGGCVLTDAEIDHTSGLLQLREGCHFGVFSTELVHRWLNSYFPIGTILSDFAERPWTDFALDDELELPLPDGRPSGLRVRAFETGQDAPRFVPDDSADLTGSIIGLEITDNSTGGKLVYAPGVATISESLKDATGGADCILLDGTFWTDDEPIQAGISDRTSRQMGHVPVDGPDGSLSWLTDMSVLQRIFVHINNTNPMLNESGLEWRTVKDSGLRVGVDGDEFEL
jgi:pyrroloquinoline quinone biosynthesis protein B